MTYTINAPSHSGYTASHDTMQDALADAARLLSGLQMYEGELVDLELDADAVVTRESGDGATIYCYASEEAADADADGSQAHQAIAIEAR